MYQKGAMTAVARIYCGVHFPLDVLFGAVLGSSTAVGVYWTVGRLLSKMEANGGEHTKKHRV